MTDSSSCAALLFLFLICLAGAYLGAMETFFGTDNIAFGFQPVGNH